MKYFAANIPKFNVDIFLPTCIEPDSGLVYHTCSSLVAMIDTEIIEVPKSYESELSIIPYWLWSITNPIRADIVEATILHDYLYSCPGSLTRAEADAVLYNALIKEGVSEYTSRKAYWSVRLFGSKHYNKAHECYPNGDDIWMIQSS